MTNKAVRISDAANFKEILGSALDSLKLKLPPLNGDDYLLQVIVLFGLHFVTNTGTGNYDIN